MNTEEYEPTRLSLIGIMHKLDVPSERQEDMLQDAFLHYLVMEERFPAHTQSWRIKGCKFHMRHLLTKQWLLAARQIPPNLPPASDDPEAEPPREAADPRCDVFACVCAREEVAQLNGKLKPVDQRILRDVQDGLSASEVGRKNGLSHQAVARHREKIENTAEGLGIQAA